MMSSHQAKHEYKEAFEAASRLATQYPDSDLADDAYAEMGWYMTYVAQNYAEAQRYFSTCARVYEGRNAADNCLYHLGITALKISKYDVATTAFSAVAAKYAETRWNGLVQAPKESAQYAAVGATRMPRGLTLEAAF